MLHISSFTGVQMIKKLLDILYVCVLARTSLHVTQPLVSHHTHNYTPRENEQGEGQREAHTKGISRIAEELTTCEH